MSRKSTPLTPRERQALEQIVQWIDGEVDTQTKTRVVEHLHGDFELAEANKLLNQLLLKGYLFEVEGRLRLTECE